MSARANPVSEADAALRGAHLRYVLRLGDTSLVLGQRLGEWVGHAPALEEDLGLANLALDLIGQARLLLTYAGEIEGRGRDEDALAFLRDAPEFMNLPLAEQPNGDFGQTIVRQWLIDAWQLEVYEGLTRFPDARLAAIAAKALKETRYHYRFSGGWLARLGDGTAESRRRVQGALEELWRFTAELFAADEVDERVSRAGIAPVLAPLAPGWSSAGGGGPQGRDPGSCRRRSRIRGTASAACTASTSGTCWRRCSICRAPIPGCAGDERAQRGGRYARAGARGARLGNPQGRARPGDSGAEHHRPWDRALRALRYRRTGARGHHADLLGMPGDGSHPPERARGTCGARRAMRSSRRCSRPPGAATG